MKPLQEQRRNVNRNSKRNGRYKETRQTNPTPELKTSIRRQNQKFRILNKGYEGQIFKKLSNNGRKNDKSNENIYYDHSNEKIMEIQFKNYEFLEKLIVTIRIRAMIRRYN